MNNNFEYIDEHGQLRTGSKAWKFTWDGNSLFEIDCNDKNILSYNIPAEDADERGVKEVIAEHIIQFCKFDFDLAESLAEEVMASGSQTWYS